MAEQHLARDESLAAAAMAQKHKECDPIGWEDMHMGKFLVMGAGVSVSCDLTLYPFDVIKTRLQASGSQSGAFPKYTGTFNAISVMARMEGRRGLYRGFAVTALGYLPSDLIYFSSYEYGKHFMKKNYATMRQKLTFLPESATIEPIVHLCMAGCAEMASSTVWMPVDIIAQKLMVQGPLQTPKYTSARHAIRKIYQSDGLRGFYRGFLATMLTFSSQSAISWGTYEFLRRRSMFHYPDHGLEHEMWTLCHKVGIATEMPEPPPDSVEKHEWLIHVVAGTMAGGTAAVFTNPLDVIKTRLQIQDYHSKDANGDVQDPRFKSMRSMARGILAEEGLRGFAKGMWARVMYLAPVSALTFLTYEFLKKVAKIDPDELEND